MNPEEKTFLTGKVTRNFKHAVKMIAAREQLEISEMIAKGLLETWPELKELQDKTNG